MGYFDEMKNMLGRGMNVADRKTQELRLQADLSRISSSLESAYSTLGKALYTHPAFASQIQRECPGEYNVVASLLKEEQSVRRRIEEVQQQAAMTNLQAYRQAGKFSCPKCGTFVTLDMAFCPTCGDNLSELKSRYRVCPNCNTYYDSDSVFCVQCGSKTIEVPIAKAVQRYVEDKEIPSDTPQVTEPSTQDDSQASIDSSPDHETQDVEAHIVEDPLIPKPLTCPRCGAVISADAAFCGECGARLNG